MGDMCRCKHGSHQGYCDECSPGWEIELIKADAADKIYARGIEKGKEEAAYEIDRLRAEILYLQKEKASLKEERERANAIIDRLNKREADHIKRVRKAEEEKELRERLLDIKYAEGMESKVADLTQQLAAANGRVEMLEPALRNLLWAATERDKKNRIRQFDEFVDAAQSALSKLK